MNNTILYSTNIYINPSILSWCPYNNRCLLAVGTYALKDDNNSQSNERDGQICWFSLTDDNKLMNAGITDTDSGVFRMCWSMINSKPTLMAALTSGRIALIDVDKFAQSPIFIKMCDAMALCVAVDTEINPSTILLGDSKGLIHLYSLETSKFIADWVAHTVPMLNSPTEVWSVAFAEDNRSNIVSGGDDGLLKLWDVRSDQRHLSIINKSHGSGVTCIKCHPKQQWTLLTGSYDQNVRMWDLRSLKQPISCIDVGGGVWHMEPISSNQWLVACMFNGWSAFECNSEGLKSFSCGLRDEKHLLYGVSACPNRPNIAAFCWFYDKCVGLFDPLPIC